MAVANGTYAITANRCVQCSCGPGNLEYVPTDTDCPLACFTLRPYPIV